MLYETLKNFSQADSGNIQLLYSKKLLFHLLWLGDKESSIFWKNTDELQKTLNLEMTVSIKESLKVNPESVNESYPIQILRKGRNFQPRDENTIHAQYTLLYGSDEEKNAFLFQPKNGLYPSLFEFQKENDIFLSGSGGMGKTFLLQHQNGLYLSLEGFRKHTLLSALQSTDFVEFLIE